jgi:RHS repeat-associated protein
VTTVTTAITANQSREKTFTSQTRYDSLSRPKLYSYPISGLTLRNEYNGLGFTTKVVEQRSGGDITHWQANARNALGQITSMSIGGQIATNVIGQTTTKTYDSIGRVKSISTGTLQAASYEWDLIGNLTRRSDAAANAVNGGNEYFCHDKLNRVTHASAGALNCTNPPSANFSYDPLGNLTKPSVTVAYQANSNKLLTVNGQTVQYDVGGNIISDAWLPNPRTYTYNPYDIPDSITQTHTTGNNPGTYQSQWGFGPDKQRTYELMLKAPVNGGNYSPIGMTWQPSPGHFELDEEINLNGTWVINECRHTIGSPEGNIGVVATNCISGNTMSNSTDRYYLKDHLGSNAGTFKQNVLESLATYDVWGMRVESGNAALSGFDTSQRGYTGHEHLAMFGLIHMNGRIYDPLLGRFLQADPIIDEPFNLQSYNRYAYVSNNPLAFTDPTGYSKWTNFRDRYGKTVLAVVAAFYIGPAAANWGTFAALDAGIAFDAAYTIGSVVGGAAGGFAAGGIQGGNLNSALSGAFSGALFGFAGSEFKPGTFSSYAAHAGAGCASGAASGGGCGAGAAGAVAGKLFTNITVSTLGQTPGAHFAGAVIGGGMGSLAAGGKFETGAYTAAMGYALNYCSTGESCWKQVQEATVGAARKGLENLKDLVVGFIPGSAAVDCAQNGCTGVALAIAAVDIVPGGGKAVSLGGKGLSHIMARHLAGGAESAGKSIFHKADELSRLATEALSVPAVPSGRNFARVVDAGREIGLDRVTGQATSWYTVITNKAGDVVTMHPGKAIIR